MSVQLFHYPSFFFFFNSYCIRWILVLILLFLVAENSLSLLFLCSLIDVLIQSPMLAGPFPLSFLDTYRLPMSSLGYKAWSILYSDPFCWSSSLVHYKNGPRDLIRGTAQVFIPLMRFLHYGLVSGSFFVLLRYYILSFSLISTCLMVSASNNPKYL